MSNVLCPGVEPWGLFRLLGLTPPNKKKGNKKAGQNWGPLGRTRFQKTKKQHRPERTARGDAAVGVAMVTPEGTPMDVVG